MSEGYPRVFVKKIVVENFKSIKSLELELEPGINLLVGPNGGGKTNILEALYFLYKALVEDAGKIPYVPHSPRYWSPLDLVYMRDPESSIVIGFDLEYYLSGNESVFQVDIHFKTMFKYDALLNTIIPTSYELSLSEDTKFHISMEGLEVRVNKNLLGKAQEVSKDVMKTFEEKYTLEGEYYVLKTLWRTPAPKPLIFTKLPIPLSKADCRHGETLICVFEELIPVVKDFRISYIVSARRVRSSRGLTVKAIEKEIPSLGMLQYVINKVLSGILLLRHPDIGTLREPKPFTGEMRLDDRAVNLAPVLLALQGRRGGFPSRIGRALGELFPGLSFRLESRFGRVVLVGEEDGLELPPPNMPDGAIKLLAILTAIELGPSLLLIDEIENSMHARMLEYVVDELNSLEIPVIVATHSPVVVDLVGPERTIIVYKKLEEGTVAERIRDPGELSRRLRELGLSFSDYVFYKKTYEL